MTVPHHLGLQIGGAWSWSARGISIRNVDTRLRLARTTVVGRWQDPRWQSGSAPGRGVTAHDTVVGTLVRCQELAQCFTCMIRSMSRLVEEAG